MAVHKLHGLEYLAAVDDCGGFNAAGRQLGVAAPSVRRLVQALEAELGLPLIDRSVGATAAAHTACGGLCGARPDAAGRAA